MRDSKKAALDEFVFRLLSKFGNKVKEIYLFGSYARGDYSKNSDIDVLIIGNGIDQREVSELTWEILMKYGEVISAIVENAEEFQRYRESSFHKSLIREGIRIG